MTMASIGERDWRGFGRIGIGGLRSKKKRRMSQTAMQDADLLGDFRFSGRTDPLRLKTPGAEKTAEGKQKAGSPRYVSSADIAGFNTTQKIEHEMLNKRVLRIKQPGMGPVDKETGKATRGTLWERWKGGGSRFSGGYGSSPFGR